MKSSTLGWNHYQALAGSSANPNSSHRSIGAVLKNSWEMLISVFGASEPRVWQIQRQSGKTEWHAYHPRTGNFTQSESEVELRAWLEEQYYQPVYKAEQNIQRLNARYSFLR